MKNVFDTQIQVDNLAKNFIILMKIVWNTFFSDMYSYGFRVIGRPTYWVFEHHTYDKLHKSQIPWGLYHWQ